MSSVLKRAFRAACSLRTIVILALAAFATIDTAAGRGSRPSQSQGAPITEGTPIAEDAPWGIDAVVADIQGTTAITSGGLSIDLSRAFISSISGELLDLTAIKVGTRMRATLVVPNDASSPFAAKFVEVRLDDEILLYGELQAVDIANKSLTILNRRLVWGPGTVFDFGPGFKKLKVGRFATIAVETGGPEPFATRVYLDNQRALIGVGFF